ncbi:TetR/AcrR family transcriptional regulator [uncultured Senegalimassilia sp.]|uniref:TetR/AcrR family transcriptional regulator n=1 Tax=uncultured Senegalimassilia sp. TaxID=1714350 RepID=UPI00343F0CA9
MVAEQAELNRGTFYYHFKSMDDLVDRVIEDEVLGNGSILQNMLSLVAGSSTANGFETFIKQDIERIALLIKQGGMNSFSIKIKCLMFDTWKAILCDEGEKLSPSTRMIIEYSTSGVIGIIAYGALHGSGEVPPRVLPLVREKQLGFPCEADRDRPRHSPRSRARAGPHHIAHRRHERPIAKPARKQTCPTRIKHVGHVDA